MQPRTEHSLLLYVLGIHPEWACHYGASFQAASPRLLNAIKYHVGMGARLSHSTIHIEFSVR